MKKYSKEKAEFFRELSNFANSIGKIISKDDKWTIKGFIDIFKSFGNTNIPVFNHICRENRIQFRVGNSPKLVSGFNFYI